MKKRNILVLAVLPFLLVTGACSGEEKPAAAEPVDPVAASSEVAELAPAEVAAPALATVEAAAADFVAPEGVDELSLSNAVIVAAAAARAAEEVRLAASAKEKEEAKAEAEAAKAAAKAEAEAAKAEAKAEAAEAEAKAEASLARRRISTRTYRLVHASADDVAEKINATWSGDFGVTWKINKMAIAFPESNTVMITAPALILEACEEVIRAVDVEPQQVYVEARFVELSNNVSHKLGIDWSMLDGMKGSLALDAGYNERKMEGVSTYNSADNSYTLSSESGHTGPQNANLSHVNATIGMSELYVILRALESSEDARTFSNPKIIVSSGKKATVDMTTKYPNVTVAVKRTINDSTQSLDLDMKMAEIPGQDNLMFAKEAYFSWGITLDVTPRISTNGLINVTIVPTISALDTSVESSGFVQATDTTETSSKYPVINVQRLLTEFNMASGTTAVIGGLSRTVEKQVDSGIPWLRDWWWVGPRLFGSKQRVKEQREIIVFVTVGLVDPKDVRKDAGLPKNAVLGRQYTKGQKLEPGDRPEKNLEGIGSLDLRSLEEQAQDPLPAAGPEKSSWIPFVKDPTYRK